MKVILIGGYPGSGKSYIVRKLLDNFPERELMQERLLHVKSGNLLVMGSYEDGNLFPGSDRLSMSVQPTFEKFLLSKIDFDDTILSEGDRLFNGATIRFLYENRIPNSIFIVTAEQKTIVQRRRERSVQNESWRQGRQTKIDNIAKQIKHTKLPNNSELEAEQAVEILMNIIGGK